MQLINALVKKLAYTKIILFIYAIFNF